MRLRLEPQFPSNYDDTVASLLAWSDLGDGPEAAALAGLVISALAFGLGDFDEIRNEHHIAALLESGLALMLEGEPK